MADQISIFNSGDVIFKQGDYEPWFYDIAYGKVGIYADYGTDNEKLLTTLAQGQTFGEMGVIECYPRSATAVALEDKTELTRIDSVSFSRYFKERPEKLTAIMQQMSQRIRELTKDYIDACQALTEAVDSESNATKKKSLKAKLKKFLDAYAQSLSYMTEHGSAYWQYYGMMN